MSRLRVTPSLFLVPALALSLAACTRAPETDAARAPTAPAPAPSASIASPTPSAAAASVPPSHEAALALHRSAIVIDTHNDVTQRLVVQGVDLATRLPDGQTDLPRMREGGLDAEFLSVFVPAEALPERASVRAVTRRVRRDRQAGRRQREHDGSRAHLDDVRNAAAAGKNGVS